MTGDEVAIISIEKQRLEGMKVQVTEVDIVSYWGGSLGRSFSVDDYHVVSNLMSLI